MTITNGNNVGNNNNKDNQPNYDTDVNKDELSADTNINAKNKKIFFATARIHPG